MVYNIPKTDIFKKKQNVSDKSTKKFYNIKIISTFVLEDNQIANSRA